LFCVILSRAKDLNPHASKDSSAAPQNDICSVKRRFAFFFTILGKT
jgi:hypothetical protein